MLNYIFIYFCFALCCGTCSQRGPKGEHKCTRGWPGSLPVGLHTFKIETQICVSNKVQVNWICRSSICENTSTCHLIKKSGTNGVCTSSLLHLRPLRYLHLATQKIKVAYTKCCKQLKYFLIVAQSIIMLN